MYGYYASGIMQNREHFFVAASINEISKGIFNKNLYHAGIPFTNSTHTIFLIQDIMTIKLNTNECDTSECTHIRNQLKK